jgi:hypothetical protein
MHFTDYVCFHLGIKNTCYFRINVGMYYSIITSLNYLQVTDSVTRILTVPFVAESTMVSNCSLQLSHYKVSKLIITN